MPDGQPFPNTNAARKRWMAVLARAGAGAIAGRLAACGGVPEHTRLRGPESGLVMARGRAGGGGAPFNLGEITVTRCTVRSADGLVGHAYVTGRDGRHAELAALVDALMQYPGRVEALERVVVGPLEAAERARRAAIAAKAEATKVQFFAMRNMRT
jgi:alpha-D-ribose 1-methylphosphonate 5-triphosphate synthase subunit PhnG